MVEGNSDSLYLVWKSNDEDYDSYKWFEPQLKRGLDSNGNKLAKMPKAIACSANKTAASVSQTAVNNIKNTNKANSAIQAKK